MNAGRAGSREIREGDSLIPGGWTYHGFNLIDQRLQNEVFRPDENSSPQQPRELADLAPPALGVRSERAGNPLRSERAQAALQRRSSGAVRALAAAILCAPSALLRAGSGLVSVLSADVSAGQRKANP